MDVKDLAYIAGILDGEGTINCIKVVTKRVPTKRSDKTETICHKVSVIISNSSKDLIDYLSQKLGHIGRVYKLNSLMYHFHIRNAQQAEFLSWLLPYLVIKKQQAELAIKFYQEGETYNHKWNVGISSQELNRRETIRLELCRLNGRKTKSYTPKQQKRLSEVDSERGMRQSEHGSK